MTVEILGALVVGQRGGREHRIRPVPTLLRHPPAQTPERGSPREVARVDLLRPLQERDGETAVRAAIQKSRGVAEQARVARFLVEMVQPDRLDAGVGPRIAIGIDGRRVPQERISRIVLREPDHMPAVPSRAGPIGPALAGVVGDQLRARGEVVRVALKALFERVCFLDGQIHADHRVERVARYQAVRKDGPAAGETAADHDEGRKTPERMGIGNPTHVWTNHQHPPHPPRAAASSSATMTAVASGEWNLARRVRHPSRASRMSRVPATRVAGVRSASGSTVL